MKKKLIYISLVILGLAITGATVLYFMDWGNAESEVDRKQTNVETNVETVTGAVINDFGTLEGTYLSSNNSEIMFELDGLKGTKGKFKKFSIGFVTGTTTTTASIEVTIDASSIYTANSMRDEHLIEADFFDVAQFPEITFRSTSIELGETTYIAKGVINFMGKEKDIDIPFSYGGAVDGAENHEIFEGQFTFDRVEFGMAESSSVGNEVKVSFYTEMIK